MCFDSIGYLHCRRPCCENILKIVFLILERNKKNAHNLTKCSPLQIFLYLQSQWSTFPISFWNKVTRHWYLFDTVFIDLMRSPFYIVLLKRILMKTMLRKYYRLCFKSFFNPLSANRAKWSHTLKQFVTRAQWSNTLKQFVTRAKWSNMLKQFVTRAKWTNTLKQFVGKMVKHAQTIRRQNGQTRSNNSWQKPFWNSTFVAKTFSEICFCVTAYDISGTIGIFTCMIS